jgi:hypothetical protein
LYTAGLFSVGWKGDIPFWTALIYANVFFLMYTLVPYGYHLRTMGTAKLSEFAIALPNALIAFAYSYALIQDEHSRQAVSVLTIAYAMLYLGLAQWMHRHNAENKTAVVMLLAKASIFLVATVPILFSGNWITMFWAIEALVLLWAANKLDNRILFGGSLAVLALAPLRGRLQTPPHGALDNDRSTALRRVRLQPADRESNLPAGAGVVPVAGLLPHRLRDTVIPRREHRGGRLL